MDDVHLRDVLFRRYKIMSYITGTTLLLLFVLLILHHTLSVHDWHHFGMSAIDRVVGIGHGLVLYPIYLVTCFMLMLKARLPLLVLLAMMLAGFVPLLAFAMEYWVARRLGYVVSKE